MKQVILILIAMIGSMFGSSLLSAQCTSTIYVKSDATGLNDGSSWDDAHTTIQAALDQAEACSTIREIWVAEGTYKPTVDIAGDVTNSLTANRTLVVDFNVKLYGGFGGYETSTQQRIKHLFPSIISGDHNGGDFYSTDPLNSSVANFADNSYNLMRFKNLDNNTIIDGFTFIGGNAVHTGTFSKRTGAAIFNDGRGTNSQSNPIISNCIFRNNRSDIGGGAVYNYGEDSDASPTFIGCEFKYNLASRFGGGAVVNFAKNLGAKSNPKFVSCLFESNFGGDVNIDNTPYKGGAILNISESFGKAEPFLKNCTVVNNQSEYGGGVSSTNTSDHGTIGTNPTTTIVNTILQNTATISNDNLRDDMTITNVSYSIFPEIVAYPGIGNMDVTPMFKGLSNFRLRFGSPAIDKGEPLGIGLGSGPVYDIENNARGIGEREDIGAYEFLMCPDNDSIYVNENQFSNSPSGRSINTGLNSLTMALEMTKSCTGTPHLIISEGTYVPHRSSQLLPEGGELRRAFNFSIYKDMTITGSQPSSSLSTGQPGLSILSGDIYRNDIFIEESKFDNVYNVLEIVGNVAILNLKKIEVQRGYNLNAPAPVAPGIHIGSIVPDSLELVIEECIIRKNKSFFVEIGTIDIDLTRGDYNLDAKFINTNITSNDANNGAAIRINNVNNSSNLLLDTCRIQGNDTDGFTGPLTYISSSALDDNILIREGDIQENDGALGGGALFFSFINNAKGDVRIEGSKIQDNEGSIGGAIYYDGTASTNLTIQRSAIYNNDALTSGGALFLTGGKAEIFNSVFSNNEVLQEGSSGGAIQIDMDSRLTSINNTFYNNEAQIVGGAIWASQPTASAFIGNCIFRKNEVNGSVSSVDFSASTVTDSILRPRLQHSLMDDLTCPSGVECHRMLFNEDPLIEGNVGSLNFTPGAGSPAVNKGNLHLLPGIYTDYTGVNYRITDYDIDIGAYEVPQECTDILFLNGSGNTQSLVGAWSSSDMITVGSGNKTILGGWLILDAPNVIFEPNYEFNTDEGLEVYTDGCINN